MERALEPPGETRTVSWVLRQLAARLDVPDFYPWAGEDGPIDALIDHPSTGGATVAALRAEDGMRALSISHVAHPDLAFPTPSRKIELYSERARALGLPPLPVYEPPARLELSALAAPGPHARRTSTASTTTGRRCPRWPGSTPSPSCGSRSRTARSAASPTGRPSGSTTSAARCGRAPA